MDRFHRIICDEAHQKQPKYANAALRWAVTGTPITKAFSDIGNIMNWLGHLDAGLGVAYTLKTANKSNYSFDHLLGALKQILMRHTKSQRIVGEAALALPELDAATIWVDMTAIERLSYNSAKSSHVSSYKGLTVRDRDSKLVGLDFGTF